METECIKTFMGRDNGTGYFQHNRKAEYGRVRRAKVAAKMSAT